MLTASATDVKNRFGEYMDAAQKEAVSVEKTGRPCVVIVSKEEHDRLRALEDAYWAGRADEAKSSGFLGPDATIARMRARLDAIERGEDT
jgi:prevent-host-death family protein